MQDAWRAYLELALGLTEASKKRAQAAARKLVGSSGATAAQLQTMAEELVSTGMANREALIRIIRVEIDRTLAALGLASADEVTALTDRVARLERELSAARAGAPGGAVGAAATEAGEGRPPGRDAPAGSDRPAKKTVAKKAVAKKTVAKKAVAKKAVAKKAVANQPTAKKTVARKADASKAVAVKKSVPGRAVAKRTAPPGGDAA